MHKYSYSYKADSSNEPIGYIVTTNVEDVIHLVAEIKQLTVQQVEELFNIKRIDI